MGRRAEEDLRSHLVPQFVREAILPEVLAAADREDMEKTISLNTSTSSLLQLIVAREQMLRREPYHSIFRDLENRGFQLSHVVDFGLGGSRFRMSWQDQNSL